LLPHRANMDKGQMAHGSYDARSVVEGEAISDIRMGRSSCPGRVSV